VKVYLVGGCVRDELDPKFTGKIRDIDSVVMAKSFDEMHEYLIGEGYEPFEVREDMQVIRAHFPRDHAFAGKYTADFTLPRIESDYDGRRPGVTGIAESLEQDLSRRDFTINAIAKDTETGRIIDPFGGQADIRRRVLRFVGDPEERLNEDFLRAVRGIRFSLTKGLFVPMDHWLALNRPRVAEGINENVSTERIEKELHKMFLWDTEKTLMFLATKICKELREAIFRGNAIKLRPTMAKSWSIPS